MKRRDLLKKLAGFFAAGSVVPEALDGTVELQPANKETLDIWNAGETSTVCCTSMEWIDRGPPENMLRSRESMRQHIEEHMKILDEEFRKQADIEWLYGSKK